MTKKLLGKCFSDTRGNLNISIIFLAMTQVSSVTQAAPKIATVTPFETKTTSRVAAIEPAGDFDEDPFKNYRYEDPFLISDPFQDEPTAPAPAVTKGSFE